MTYRFIYTRVSAEAANRIPSTDPVEEEGKILYLVLDTNVLIKDLGFVEDLVVSVPGGMFKITCPK